MGLIIIITYIKIIKKLTVTYKFGNKLIQTNQHGAGNDEERGRIKN